MLLEEIMKTSINNTISGIKKTSQSGQGIIEFIIGIAFLALIIMGAILGFNKVISLVKESFRDDDKPTTVPTIIVTPEPNENQYPSTIPDTIATLGFAETYKEETYSSDIVRDFAMRTFSG